MQVGPLSDKQIRLHKFRVQTGIWMKETGNLPFEQAAKVRLAKELLPPPLPPTC